MSIEVTGSQDGTGIITLAIRDGRLACVCADGAAAWREVWADLGHALDAVEHDQTAGMS